MSIGTGATIIVRDAAGPGSMVGSSWVSVDVAADIGDTGVGVEVAGVDSGVPWGSGVEMVLDGDGVMALDSTVVKSGVGVASGVVAWPEQAANTVRTRTSAQIGSLLIRFLLSF